MTSMTASLTETFTVLAKTPQKYAEDAQKFLDALEVAGKATLSDAEKVMGSYVLKDLEDSTEHFLFAAATHYPEHMHTHIEEKAEMVHKMADRLRAVLR